MGQWVDFKQLRARLRFSEVLELYDVKLKVKGDQAQGFCPLPTHDGERNSPSFSANLPRGLWQCFGCGAKGNVLDFAVCMEGLSPDNSAAVRTVALKLQERFQADGTGEKKPASSAQSSRRRNGKRQREREETLSYPVTEKTRVLPAPKIKINEPLDFELKGLEHGHPYLRKRGFDAQVLWRLGVGYCARGLMAGRIAIPLRDTDGRLVGYAGRIVDDSKTSEENPKYKFPSRRERDGVVYEFRKSHLLYNAERIKKPVDHLVVVEGFASVWWLHQAGIENVVALMGSSCSPEQAAIVLAKTTPSARLSVFPDGDEAGVRCAQSVFQALGSHRWVRWVQPSDRRQPTDCPPDEVNQLLRA